jgi:hypothetical protein
VIKQSKSVYIIGSIVIGIITIIAILAGLMLSGIIDASSKKLVYKSMSEEKIYDGETLICDEYALEEGQLKEGHVAEFTFIGEQTEVGESDNAFVVTILDENGADVTSDYEIVTQFGKLSVLPRPLTVKSGDAVEEYNGSVVKNEEVKLTSGELMQGHSIEYVVTGSRVDAGVTENTFVAIVRDESGRDVTKNYKIEYTYGKLEVLPMEVAIVSADKNVTYDGVGYDSTNDFWKYANPEKRPAEGLEVIVIFSTLSKLTIASSPLAYTLPSSTTLVVFLIFTTPPSYAPTAFPPILAVSEILMLSVALKFKTPMPCA